MPTIPRAGQSCPGSRSKLCSCRVSSGRHWHRSRGRGPWCASTMTFATRVASGSDPNGTLLTARNRDVKSGAIIPTLPHTAHNAMKSLAFWLHSSETTRRVRLLDLSGARSPRALDSSLEFPLPVMLIVGGSSVWLEQRLRLDWRASDMEGSCSFWAASSRTAQPLMIVGTAHDARARHK